MDYQNKPVEWSSVEDTEKVAANDNSGRSTTNNTINTLGQLALVGGGAEIARRGINADHTAPSKTREFIKEKLKPIGKKAIIAGGATAALGHSGVKAMDFAATELIGKHAPESVDDLAQIAKVRAGASRVRAAGAAAAIGGAGALLGRKYMKTRVLDKKRLAAKLGLIAGGTALTGAGLYGLVNEKKASAKKDESSGKNWKLGVGGTLGLATGLALDSAPISQNKARIAARAGLLASAVPLMSGSLIAADRVERNAARMRRAGTFYKNRKAYNVARGITAAGLAAGFLAPAAAMAIPNKHNKKLLAAKLGLVTGGTAAIGTALYNATKDKTASRKEDKSPSGWNRFARGVLGHIALPTIGAAATGAGAVLADASDHINNPFAKAALLGTGSLLAAGGIGTMIGGPIANDAYQAYRYIQEH